MSDAKGAFDPYAEPAEDEAPVVKLRNGREVVLLSDIKLSHERALDEIRKRFNGLHESEDKDGRALADVVGELVEAASRDQVSGVREELVAAWDAEEIGVNALSGLMRFVLAHVNGDTDPEG